MHHGCVPNSSGQVCADVELMMGISWRKLFVEFNVQAYPSREYISVSFSLQKENCELE